MIKKHYLNLYRVLFITLFTALLLPLGAQSGCFLDAGELDTPSGSVYVPICLDDGDEQPIEIIRTGFVGGTSQYFLTTPHGFILQVLQGNPPFDLSSYGAVNLAIWSVSYSGTLTNAQIGDNICSTGSTECFSLSNPIVINRKQGDGCDVFCTADAGMITLADGSGNTTSICISDTPVPTVAVTLSGDPSGENLSFVITDDQGTIISIPEGNGPFDLSGNGVGTCLIWYVAFDDDVTGIAVGNNASDFDGCFALSNPITVERNSGADCDGAMDANFEAMLSGLNELPCPVTTTGTGMVTATLSGNTLTVSGSFSGLISDFDPNVAGGAHLHIGMAGEGGPIAFSLTTDLDDDSRGGTFAAADNTFELTDEQAMALMARGVYVNIHTVDFGAGELRGQLVPSGADDYNVAYLLGVNEVPAVRTSAVGAVILERTGNNIIVSGSFSGLMGDIATEIAGGAHIHLGVAGRNGPVIIPLNLTIGDDMTSAAFLADNNNFELTADQAEAFDNGGLYVNIHSRAETTGELRGQVLDMTVTQFYSNPSGHQTRPVAINTPGNGRLLMTLDADNNLVVSGSVNDLQGDVDLNIAGGAHIHEALAGTSGPIAFELSITLDADGNGGVWEPANNTFALSDEDVEDFYARRYYVNVHTLDEATGEVRGQVLNLAKAYFGSNLAGINANPEAKKTTGSGFVIYEGCNNNIVVTGSFADLQSDFDANVAGGSHIHFGDATATGPIVASLDVDLADDLRSGDYEAADNMIMLDSAGFAAMLAGDYYFNLHTVDNPSGEIRGQILRDDNAFPTSAEIITPEEGARVTVFEGGSDLEDGRFFAASDPNGDTLVYTIEIVSLLDTNFTMIIACEKVGADTSSNATIDTIYQTLIDFGALPGMEVPLRYRVVASDGSVSTPGGSRTITLVIGQAPVCDVMGGTLTLENGDTTATICAGDGIPDPFGVILTDTTGTDSFTYIVVSDQGVILGVPADQPFDFDGAGEGACTLYAVSHDGTLTGAVEDAMFADLGGCFALSNPIVITRNTGDDCEEMVDMDFEAMLSGLNELPCPVTTTGKGMVSATLSGNTLTVSGSFSDLTSDFDPNVAGGAHLHLGMAGMNGGIIFQLTTDLDDDLRGGTFNAADNVFTLDDDQAEALRARGIYVNIHTLDFGGGELRGQLVPSGADDYNVAYLLGVNEVPSVVTPAVGGVILERTGSTITVTGSFSGLTGTIATDIAGGAHIHTGVAGRNGAVIIPLGLTIGDDMTSATLLAEDNTFELTADQAEAFDNGGLYVNIHSSAFRSGELRGQVLDMSVTQFYSNPSGHQARPMAINTPGNGRLLMTLDADNNLVVSGSVNDLQGPVDLNVAGGSHIHEALAGTSGPISFGLNITLDDDGTGGIWEPANNTFALTAEDVEDFYARRYYVNVHTTAEASGEVRGQVMNLAKAYFGSNLDGINANPDAIKTTGGGFIMYEGCNNNIVATGSFADLMSDFDANVAGGSHIHAGDATTSGPIVASLNVNLAGDLRSGEYEAADNMIMLDSAGFAAMVAGNYYFNLHTVDNPSGEIRGQILRDDNAFPTSAEIIVPEDGATVTVTSQGSDLEDGRFFSATDPDNDPLVYTIEIVFVNDTEFTNILACEKVGTDTSSNATIESVYQTLRDFGAGPGTTVRLRYRVVASDGSVSTPGGSRTITLIIGQEPECEVTGGMLTLADGGFRDTICAGDGIPDPFNVVLTDTLGTDEFTYVIVSDAGVILGVQENQPFDFDGAGGGACTLYAVTHDGTLTGAVQDAPFSELGGCFALSNPIVITRLTGADCGMDIVTEFVANLSGLEQTPCPVTTTGTGTINASLDGNTLTVTGVYSGLESDFTGDEATGTDAHIHMGMAGMTAPLSFLLTPTTNDDMRSGTFAAEDNTFTLTDAQVDLLQARGFYINLHTVDQPTGEIRGQLLPAGADEYRLALLSGVNEVPSVVTPAGGTVVLERTGNTIVVSGSFQDLTGDIFPIAGSGAHIHVGVAGRNGSVIIPLSLEASEDMRSAVLRAEDNTFELTDDQAEAFSNDGLYVNVHSSTVNSGELRGQIAPMGLSQFYSNPSGHQTRPVAINTPGNGRLLLSLDNDMNLVVSGSVNDLMGDVALEIAGGAHIHEALPGTSGPIAFELTITLDADGKGGVWEPANNTFALTAEDMQDFFDRRYYVNVHSSEEMSGEVRGQVMNLAKGYYGSNLAGINANPEAKKTAASGFVMYEACRRDFIATGSFAGLESDFAANIAGGSHIHRGAADTVGGISFSLDVDISEDLRSGEYLAENNQFEITPAFMEVLEEGGYYFNLHTVDNPSGEIRGQILRDDNAFPGDVNVISPENGELITVFEGGSSFESADFTNAIDPDGDLVVYTVEATLGNDSLFENALGCVKIGTDTFGTLFIGAIYDTLIANGAVPGTTIDFLYRIIASDGSVANTGETRSLTVMLTDPPPCNVTAGMLQLSGGGDSLTICADGIPDPFNVVLTDTVGTDEFTYLVVSDEGVILGVPADQPFDFDVAGGGTCTLYAVSHDGTLDGAEVDGMFEDLRGCFRLSNPIVVTRLTGDECGGRRLTINEVDRDGMVELINLSRVNVSAGALYLASNDQFSQISDLRIECGNLLLKPGDQVTVDASGILTAEGDELALLTQMLFTPVENLVSYVAWGEGDRMFEEMAFEVGLWTETTELGAPNSAVSIQRVPSQTNVYALGAPTQCAPNSLTTGTIQPAADRVSVFPNPFGDVLTLEVSGLRSAGRTDLQLLDVNGRLILTRQLDQADSRIELQTGQLAAGTYLLRLTNEAGVSTARVIHR